MQYLSSTRFLPNKDWRCRPFSHLGFIYSLLQAFFQYVPAFVFGIEVEFAKKFH